MLSHQHLPSHSNTRPLVLRVLFCLCVVGISSQAGAADLNWPLRGREHPIETGSQWGGLYAGAQVGYSTARADLTNVFSSMNIFNPNNTFTAPLGSVSASPGVVYPDSISYGLFGGYNSIWEDAMIGVEANYNHLAQGSGRTASYATTATLGDGYSYNVSVNVADSAHVTDVATFRARAGWTYGSYMPYAFGGLAVGLVNLTRSVTATGTPTGAGTAFTATEGGTIAKVGWGWAAGTGIDIMLKYGLFARVEYEFLRLNDAAPESIDVNSLRFGVGKRF